MRPHLAVASKARIYADAIAGTGAQVVDTRKTLPGLRIAQKYAVRCGGGGNHRLALWDAILLKENHILAAGGIAEALEEAELAAHRAGDRCKFVQTEWKAWNNSTPPSPPAPPLSCSTDFDLDLLREAARRTGGRAILEASGNVSLDTIRAVEETGVDRISVGSLTKDVKALDLSMRFLA